MDDFFFMNSPYAAANPASTGTVADNGKTEPTAESSSEASDTINPATGETSASNPRSSWSSWGSSFNKLIERGKKDMNEFVDVTRKDLNELVHTVQTEHSTAITTISKKVDGIKTSLPTTVTTNSSEFFGRMSHMVEGIRQEITEAATGVSSQAAASNTSTSTGSRELAESTSTATGKETSVDNPSTTDTTKDNVSATEAEAPSSSSSTEPQSASTEKEDTSTAETLSTTKDKHTSLSLASTANFFAASATSLSQSLTSSTKDISTSANQLFKKTIPAAAEKQLGGADQFFKHTTESLKSNGLIAEQYVNRFGAGMANFINSAVTISAPEKKEAASSRSKKMFFDRKAAMLEKLRMDPETYTVDPMTTIADNDVVSLGRYKYFLQTFNLAEYHQRNSRLLNEYPEVKSLMTKLVPVEIVDEELFWQRYYFRLFEMEEEEKRRQKLVQEAGTGDAEDEFTWDDNEDEDEDSTGGQGSITPKAEKKNAESAVTPKASQILSTADSPQVKQEPLTAEAMGTSLATLPIPNESTAGDDEDSNGKPQKVTPGTGSEDEEWGSESPQSSTPSVVSASATHTKSPSTNLSSTRTSEDAYEVVDGVATPVRVPLANVLANPSPTVSSTQGQPSQAAKTKAAEKDEDDWSDWE